MSSAPKPKLTLDLVALGTFAAFEPLYGTSIQTTSSPSFNVPTVQLGVHV